MNLLDVVVQGFELGAELLGTARRQAQDLSDTAREHAKEFRSAARGNAEDFGKTVGKRARDFGETASDRVRDFGEAARESLKDVAEQVPKKAKRIRKAMEARFEPEPSIGSRVLPFFAGFSVGLGAALLFAPRSGRETRAKLMQFKEREQELPRTAEIR
ncbi:MAG TPA: hypothetical protein VF135_10865 [Terriglobales bacterium]